MPRFTLIFPDKLAESIDELVEDGLYMDRASFIREACRAYLKNIYAMKINIGYDSGETRDVDDK